MFWKREKKIISSIAGMPLLVPPIPPKKEYLHMLELLKEAEHFSNSDDKQIEIDLLELLVKAISRCKSKIENIPILGK